MMGAMQIATGLSGLNDLPMSSIVMCVDRQARRVIARVDGENLWERFGGSDDGMSSTDLITDAELLNVLPIFPVLWVGGDEHLPTEPVAVTPEAAALVNIDRIARSADPAPVIDAIIDQLNTIPTLARRRS